jgi:hypothetical protein
MSSRKLLCAASLTLLLASLAPAAHARPSETRRTARFEEGSTFVRFWSFLTELWKKESSSFLKTGMTIDPHGGTGTTGNNSGGDQGETGMTIDPHG